MVNCADLGVGVDKQALLRLFIKQLEAKLATLVLSQHAAQAGATHPETRQEDPKDTRAIEGQYLARGLAERVESMREVVARCRHLELAAFGPDDPIAVTALVALEDEDGQESLYFLVPWAGGEQLDVGGTTIRTLTPSSPLGRALVGKHVDDEVEVELPGRRLSATIGWAR